MQRDRVAIPHRDVNYASAERLPDVRSHAQEITAAPLCITVCNWFVYCTLIDIYIT